MRTLVAILVFCSGFLFANSEREEVRHLMETYDHGTLLLISNELVQTAFQEEKAGDFELALVHINRALLLREELGLLAHQSTGSLFLMKSYLFKELGNICEAHTWAVQAKQHFQSKGQKSMEEKAKKETDRLSSHCSVATR